MSVTKVSPYGADKILEALVGRGVIAASMDTHTVTLDDGTHIKFDESNDDCCSWIELKSLVTTENVITAAEFRDNEDETGGQGAYKAWLHVVTEAGELNLAEAEGDASNGYYLHGWALGAIITVPEVTS